ncbi:M48 family metallopeptidase [Sphingomonas adhaesiva]|uniref:M48 family metallopeptidase n=1 Tax=Sphingomonas adhaesiva TaxID=28212 RepID=UPI002FF5DF58
MNPQFDVDTATRAYLNLVQGPARAVSDRYFEGGEWLLLWGMLVAVAVYWLVLATGWSARWRDAVERRTRRRWLVPALYAVPFTIVTSLLMLPWSFYTDYLREHQYGMSNQTLPAWAGDAAKMLGLGLVGNILILTILFVALRRFPRAWWVWGAGGAAGLIALGALIFPIFIAPAFNNYTELPAGPLRERIVAVARAHDIPADHIYVSDASRQTKRISANVSGIGPTIRITLNDNLLNRTTPDEVVAVMGHEMGHYVLRHIWWLVAGMTLIFALLFFAASRVGPWLIRRNPRWGVRDLADPAAAPVLLALVAVGALVLTPVQNNMIRHNEVSADAFGLDAARQPDAFARTAIRLSEYRKLEPGAVEEFLFYDHPSGAARVRAAMQWKKDHVPGATMERPTLAVAK